MPSRPATPCPWLWCGPTAGCSSASCSVRLRLSTHLEDSQAHCICRGLRHITEYHITQAFTDPRMLDPG
jgi:hypothetical protein